MKKFETVRILQSLRRSLSGIVTVVDFFNFVHEM